MWGSSSSSIEESAKSPFVWVCLFACHTIASTVTPWWMTWALMALVAALAKAATPPCHCNNAVKILGNSKDSFTSGTHWHLQVAIITSIIKLFPKFVVYFLISTKYIQSFKILFSSHVSCNMLFIYVAPYICIRACLGHPLASTLHADIVSSLI